MAASGWLHWLRVRENLSLVVSGAALVVAVVGTAVSCMAADSARDQAQSAREQADVAKEAFDNESSAQSRRINLNPDGLRHVLVLQNTSTLPSEGSASTRRKTVNPVSSTPRATSWPDAR